MSDLERAHELLAWHSQDALTGEDLVFMRQWVETSGTTDPAIAQELAWLRSTAAQLRAHVEEEARLAQQPVDAGLRSLMERIALEKAAGTAHSPPEAAENTRPFGNVRVQPRENSEPRWDERVSQWLRDVVGVRSTGWAMGVMAVVAVQAGVIAVLLADPPAAQVPLSGAATSMRVSSDHVLLTVAFRPQATESAMRMTLASAGAQIVSGPSALGLYLVAVPRDQADRMAKQLLAASAVVESVQR